MSIYDGENTKRNIKLSDGFNEWLRSAHENQHRERQDANAEARLRMFSETGSGLSEFDQELHEKGFAPNYYAKRREDKRKWADLLFSDDEIERRRDKKKADRHPMDEAIRKQLEERRHRNGGF